MPNTLAAIEGDLSSFAARVSAISIAQGNRLLATLPRNSATDQDASGVTRQIGRLFFESLPLCIFVLSMILWVERERVTFGRAASARIKCGYLP
jgi:hypothetical protein